jgi:hypothetical protein
VAKGWVCQRWLLWFKILEGIAKGCPFASYLGHISWSMVGSQWQPSSLTAEPQGTMSLTKIIEMVATTLR